MGKTGHVKNPIFVQKNPVFVFFGWNEKPIVQKAFLFYLESRQVLILIMEKNYFSVKIFYFHNVIKCFKYLNFKNISS